MVVIPVSHGELVDKITILRIKRARFTEPGPLQQVQRELQLLEQILGGMPVSPPEGLIADLARVNAELWEVEDDLRDREAESDFGARFVALARSVYVLNARRSDLKRRIDAVTGSPITEEKQYGRASR